LQDVVSSLGVMEDELTAIIAYLRGDGSDLAIIDKI
jgi:hypothetical protein